MAVTVEDVRINLNEITEAELSSRTIEQAIEDAIAKAADLGISSNEIFIRKWAAYLSFIRSPQYTDISIHDLKVKRDVEAKAEQLFDDATSDLDDIDGLVVESTPMFDERPEDPNEICWP